MIRERLVGKQFGRLTCISEEQRDRKKYCMCRCECGNTAEVRSDRLISGKTRSCGCLARDLAAAAHAEAVTRREARRIPRVLLTEDERRLSTIYSGIVQRCNNGTYFDYKYYGGRGIKLCAEWSDPVSGKAAFRKWAISAGYAPGLSIDRVDNDAGYAPTNCRWVSMREQSLNRCNTLWLTGNLGRAPMIVVVERVLGVDMIGRGPEYIRLWGKYRELSLGSNTMLATTFIAEAFAFVPPFDDLWVRVNEVLEDAGLWGA